MKGQYTVHVAFADRTVDFHIEFNAYHLTLVGAHTERAVYNKTDIEPILTEVSDTVCNVKMRTPAGESVWMDERHRAVTSALAALDAALAELCKAEVDLNFLNGGIRPRTRS